MRRLHPRRIPDKLLLSRLLEQYLQALEQSPLQVTLRALSYDTRIPETIFQRLSQLHRQPEDAPNIEAADYHIVFSNILFRYPTVKIWSQRDGSIFFEM